VQLSTGKSILIVERDAIVTLLLLELVKNPGYDIVDTLTAGEEAIELIVK